MKIAERSTMSKSEETASILEKGELYYSGDDEEIEEELEEISSFNTHFQNYITSQIQLMNYGVDVKQLSDIEHNSQDIDKLRPRRFSKKQDKNRIILMITLSNEKPRKREFIDSFERLQIRLPYYLQKEKYREEQRKRFSGCNQINFTFPKSSISFEDVKLILQKQRQQSRRMSPRKMKKEKKKRLNMPCLLKTCADHFDSVYIYDNL